MADLDLQPTLVGERVRLRPLVAADWDVLFAVAADPLIWAVHPAHDRWQEPVFRRFFADALGAGGAPVVEERARGRVIGSSRYHRQPDSLEIGWTFLARDHWGGAINREVKRLMVGHALTVEPRVTFCVGEHNLRSRRALEKIGARLTPETETRAMADRPVVHVIYEIDYAAFARGPLNVL